MARLNNIVKFITWLINLVIFVFGFIGLILAFYVIFADWGGLDTGFFLGLGITGAFMAGCLWQISTLGVLAIDYQNYTYKDNTVDNKVWTGKKIILIYLICVVAGFLGTCFTTMYITNESTSLAATKSAINAGTFIPYDNFELGVSKKFNKFFFGVKATCNQLNLIWFWTFVANNCPSSIDESHCSACTVNWITSCSAYEPACYGDYDVTVVGGGDPSRPHATCPYEICRSGIITFIIDRMDTFLIIIACLLGLFGMLSILSTMLLCFHERDSNEVFLEKAGAVAKKRPKKQITGSTGAPTAPTATATVRAAVPTGAAKAQTATRPMAIDSSATPKANLTPRAAQPTTKRAAGKA